MSRQEMKANLQGTETFWGKVLLALKQNGWKKAPSSCDSQMCIGMAVAFVATGDRDKMYYGDEGLDPQIASAFSQISDYLHLEDEWPGTSNDTRVWRWNDRMAGSYERVRQVVQGLRAKELEEMA